MQTKNNIVAYLALGLALAQALLILVSWLITAAMPDVFSRSLLSAEGIRWFFGRFVGNLSSPLLVWLLLVSMAYGAFVGSGLPHYDRSEYRQRIAMRLIMIEVALFVSIMLALTIVPHAILLNVMGGLYPSSFFESIVPYACFAVIVSCVSFGLMSGTQRSVADVFAALTMGIGRFAPWFVIYVLAVQLYCSIVFLS